MVRMTFPFASASLLPLPLAAREGRSADQAQVVPRRTLSESLRRVATELHNRVAAAVTSARAVTVARNETLQLTADLGVGSPDARTVTLRWPEISHCDRAFAPSTALVTSASMTCYISSPDQLQAPYRQDNLTVHCTEKPSTLSMSVCRCNWTARSTRVGVCVW